MKLKTLTKQTLIATCLSALSSGAFAQDLNVSYYGHAGYTGKYENVSTKNFTSAFNSGGLDILINSQLSDRLKATGELFSGFRGDGATSVVLSIERLNFKYAVNDYFNLTLGRMYSPLGFWQSRYSQAQYFAPTINAPYAVRTRMDKGIIPTNSVGFQVDGENIGALGLSYYFMVDNTSGAPSLNTDNTDFKALTAKIKITPIENLDIFIAGRNDEIIKGSTNPTGKLTTEHIGQRILNGGLVHISQDSKLEYALEYYHIVNKGMLAETKNDFSYFYLGYKLGKFVPYLQGDLLNYATKDKYYDPKSLLGMVVGGRYALTQTSILKVEYKLRDSYRNKVATPHEDVYSLQFSAKF